MEKRRGTKRSAQFEGLRTLYQELHDEKKKEKEKNRKRETGRHVRRKRDLILGRREGKKEEMRGKRIRRPWVGINRRYFNSCHRKGWRKEENWGKKRKRSQHNNFLLLKIEIHKIGKSRRRGREGKKKIFKSLD